MSTSLRDFLSMWPNDYALWDLSAAYWEKDRPKMATVTLSADGYSEELPMLELTTQCLDTQKGAAVKAYLQMLKDKAFFTGKPNSNYGKVARTSTKQAQQYYGLLPTGVADRTLIELLNGAESPSVEPTQPVPSVPLTDEVQGVTPKIEYILEGQLSIRFDRAWLAHSLSPSHSSDMLDRVWPADHSNMLYIADGEIVNLSDRTLQLTMLLQGYVELNGIRYPCTIQCERDEGHSFGSSLLPMGESRLVVVCELPEGVEHLSCVLNITIQGAAQKMALQFGL